MRFRQLMGCLFGVALLPLAPVQEVVAATTTGTGTFAGTVTLIEFPCSCPSGGGSFAGQVGLALAGLSITGVPYVAAWSPPVPPATNATASFGYEEDCITQPNGTPPLIGSAGGTFSVTGGSAIVGTQQLNPATLTGNINWSRDGTLASIQFTNLVITAGSGNSTVAVNLANSLAGIATGQGGSGFVWTNGPGVCGGVPQANQTAEITGVALQPA